MLGNSKEKNLLFRREAFDKILDLLFLGDAHAMLEFFRRYQRYFFLFVTVIIIISFSFFGTYNTITGTNTHEQVAFTAVDGSPVTRGQLEQMVNFIGTDAEDKLFFGGQWGPNFLNNGVIVKDIFQTGLAGQIAKQFQKEIDQDLQTRLEKEKRYQPYTHPQAPFLSMSAAWNYFAPEIKTNFENLRISTNATSPEALDARINLYLAQKKLPPHAIRQILLYQQRQYSWLSPDPTLEHSDLSLFHYHTVDDWLGPRFMRIVAQFIINSAILAEQKGYQVTKQEALADLMRNSEISYRQNLSNPHLGVASSQEYFNEQLNRMGLDSNKASAIWRQVLLFRRLFHDAGSSLFVDSLSFQKFNEYSQATLEGEIYRLPKEFQIQNLDDLKKFEVYLNAISKRSEDEKSLLNLPTQFYSADEVAKKHPELVQKRYLLDIAEVDKNILQAKVSVKEMWNWEVENFDTLKKLFPELGMKKGDTRESRFAALDGLDEKSRNQVDSYARQQIVDQHPEWLSSALQEAPMKRAALGLKLKGGQTPFVGLTNREELFKYLDNQDKSLESYSPDKQHYYRIVVIDKESKPEIVPFAEAKKGESLNPQEIDQAQFDKLLKAIEADYVKGIAPQKTSQLLPEIIATLRFNAYAREALSKIKKNPNAASNFVQAEQATPAEDKLSPTKGLGEQWKFEKNSFVSQRGGDLHEEIFALAPNSWSKVQTPVSGDIHFINLIKKSEQIDKEALAKNIQQARDLLGDEAQQVLSEHLLKEMKSKHAISLEYLNKSAETEERT